MNLQAMEALLDQIVHDKSMKASFAGWLNDALQELASDYDFPTLKLLLPQTVTVDGSTWIWPMPASYQKNLFRCAFIDTDGRQKKVDPFDRREDLEYRDHTQIGPHVTAVAVAQQLDLFNLLIHPLPSVPVALLLWYYQKPARMVKPGDSPTCMPPEYHERVLIPRVVKKNYTMITDQTINPNLQSLAFWQAEEERGLRGDGTCVGLINHFAKSQGPPRRTGGRDPLGAGYGRRGW